MSPSRGHLFSEYEEDSDVGDLSVKGLVTDGENAFFLCAGRAFFAGRVCCFELAELSLPKVTFPFLLLLPSLLKDREGALLDAADGSIVRVDGRELIVPATSAALLATASVPCSISCGVSGILGNVAAVTDSVLLLLSTAV